MWPSMYKSVVGTFLPCHKSPGLFSPVCMTTAGMGHQKQGTSPDFFDTAQGFGLGFPNEFDQLQVVYHGGQVYSCDPKYTFLVGTFPTRPKDLRLGSPRALVN